MKKFLLIALLPLSALAAPSNFIPPGHQYGDRGNGNGDSTAIAGAAAAAGAIAGAASQSDATASAAQEQSQSQGQSQSATASVGDQSATAYNEGNSLSVAFTAPDRVTTHQKGTAELRTVPTAIAPNIYPTASCAMSASAGASTLGTGVSFGGTKVNHECVMLETARVFSQLGYPSQGLDVLCSTPTSLEVFGDKAACMAGARVNEPAAPAVVVVPNGVTHEQVNETVERAFKATVSK
jgi:hypothetical protein